MLRLMTQSVIWLACFLCVCVLSQMLGMPVTLGSLLNSADVLSQPASEDFSLLPTLPKLETWSKSGPRSEIQTSLHVPVFSQSLFHPPIH
jgi:hypothetical protein